jgi:hypothetical protein
MEGERRASKRGKTKDTSESHWNSALCGVDYAVEARDGRHVPTDEVMSITLLNWYSHASDGQSLALEGIPLFGAVYRLLGVLSYRRTFVQVLPRLQHCLHRC